METSVNHRISILIDELGFPSVRQFGHALGYTNPEKLHKLIRLTDTKPSYETLTDILSTFPKVSAEWLILGTGSVFKPTDNFSAAGDRIARICAEYDLTVESLADKIGQSPRLLHEMIEDSQTQLSKDLFVSILQAFPDISPMWLQNNDGKMLRIAEFRNNKFVFDVNESGTLEISINVRKTAL